MTNFLSSIPFVPGFLAQVTRTGTEGSDDSVDYEVHSGNPFVGLIGLAIAVVVIVALWKIFTKAGWPGWASLIPFYNTYALLKIAGKPGWWLILMFIPFVNFIIIILMAIGLAKNFGKGAGFALGIVFLSFIFLPILGFGDARYQSALMPPAL